MKKTEKINWSEIDVRGIKFLVPINIYLIDRDIYYGSGGDEIIYLKYKKDITAVDFLNTILKSNTNLCSMYLDEKGFKKIEANQRRSFTDLLGIYLSYFPKRNNEEGIIEFVKTFKKIALDNNILGHYCSTPKKIVFIKDKPTLEYGYSKYLNKEIPIMKGYYEDLCTKEEIAAWETFKVNNSFLNVQEYTDNLSFEKIRGLFALD